MYQIFQCDPLFIKKYLTNNVEALLPGLGDRFVQEGYPASVWLEREGVCVFIINLNILMVYKNNLFLIIEITVLSQ